MKFKMELPSELEEQIHLYAVKSDTLTVSTSEVSWNKDFLVLEDIISGTKEEVTSVEVLCAQKKRSFFTRLFSKTQQNLLVKLKTPQLVLVLQTKINNPDLISGLPAHELTGEEVSKIELLRLLRAVISYTDKASAPAPQPTDPTHDPGPPVEKQTITPTGTELEQAIQLKENFEFYEAEELFLILLETDSENQEIFLHLAEIYESSDNWDRFSEVLHSMSQLDTISEDERKKFLFQEAEIKENMMCDPANAIDIYHSILDLDPECFEALDCLQRLFIEQESWQEAISVMSRQAEIRPNATLHQQIAELYEQALEDICSAFKHLKLASELEPDNQEISEEILRIKEILEL